MCTHRTDECAVIRCRSRVQPTAGRCGPARGLLDERALLRVPHEHRIDAAEGVDHERAAHVDGHVPRRGAARHWRGAPRPGASRKVERPHVIKDDAARPRALWVPSAKEQHLAVEDGRGTDEPRPGAIGAEPATSRAHVDRLLQLLPVAVGVAQQVVDYVSRGGIRQLVATLGIAAEEPHRTVVTGSSGRA